MLAALTTTSVALLRTGQSAWKSHRDEYSVRESALSVLRHVTRKVRQAIRVADVSDESTSSGTLTLVMSDNARLVYAHNNGNSQALYGVTTAWTLLPPQIKLFGFAGQKTKGSTATTEPDLVHAVRCTVTYDVSRPGGTTTETVSCIAWLRSW